MNIKSIIKMSKLFEIPVRFESINAKPCKRVKMNDYKGLESGCNLKSGSPGNFDIGAGENEWNYIQGKLALR